MLAAATDDEPELYQLLSEMVKILRNAGLIQFATEPTLFMLHSITSKVSLHMLIGQLYLTLEQKSLLSRYFHFQRNIKSGETFKLKLC
jgi:hypothetical protein